MVKPMPASEAGKVAIGDVGNELDSASIWDEVVPSARDEAAHAALTELM